MARKFINNLFVKVLTFSDNPSGFNASLERILSKSLSESKNMECGNHTEPKRNVEIKAFLGTDEDYQAAVEIARNLTSTEGEILRQRDVFFKTPAGRLKLRYMQSGDHHLIYYSRSDVAGPKLSTYDRVDVPDAEGLEKVLSMCYGTRGIVEKERLLFMYRNTRIHLDKVVGLGNYLEFEVMLKPDDKIEDGEEFANTLKDIFKIKQDNLITCAYLDLLLKKQED